MKLIKFKISEILSYVSVIAVCFSLSFFFSKFVLEKEIENNISITSSIATGIIMTEKYIESNLQCATTALHLYFKSHRFPKNKEELWSLRDSVGISDYTIYGSDGKLKFGTAGGPERDTKYWNNYVKYNSCPDEKDMMLKTEDYKHYPFKQQNGKAEGSSSVDSYQYKVTTHWFKDIGMFLNAYIDSYTLSDILSSKMASFPKVNNISISSPSGSILLDVNNNKSGRRYNDVVVDKYSESPIVNNDAKNSMLVSIPFGGLKESCGTLDSDKGIYAKCANKDGQYFYVLNIDFKTRDLNSQILAIRGFFSVLCLVCILIIRLVSNYIYFKQDITDNILRLSNDKLILARRYMIKLLDSEMRVSEISEAQYGLDDAFKPLTKSDIK